MNKYKVLRYKILFSIIQNPLFFRNKKQYIFILSHMRSYSTLLSHILANNREICGYTEMHIPYYSSIDFQILKFKARERYKDHINRKYLLDKILHNSKKISENILKERDLIIIFLLRDPLDSLKSIITMSSSPNAKSKKPFDENKAANYYISRLSKLQDYSRITKEKNIFIKSENFINKTELTLDLLSKYLNLKEELSSIYSTFDYTGIPRYGDPSDYIKTGEIVMDRNKKDIIIPDKTRLLCEKAYNECYKVLSENSDENL